MNQIQPSRFPHSWRTKGLVSLLFLGVLLAIAVVPARAAEPTGGMSANWETRETDHFRYFFQPDGQIAPDDFLSANGTAIEQGYEEIGLVLDIEVADKIAVYVYSNSDDFAGRVIPADRRELDGGSVAADPRNLDLSVDLTALGSDSAIEIENQFRHGIAHILAGVASGFAVPPGFDEGFAQYAERPILSIQARIAAEVQTAHQDGSLLSWRDLNQPIAPADQDAMAGPESYAVVAFLMQQYGLPEFQQVLAALKTGQSWPDAISTVYAPETVDTLEQQWQGQIAAWASSDWQWNLLNGFNLQPAENLLDEGNYQGALDLLQTSEQLFVAIDDRHRREDVETLQTQAAIGIQAESLMTDTQQELEKHSYERALTYLDKAKEQYQQLPPEQRPTDLLSAYESIATSGTEAIATLQDAALLSRNWRDSPEAREKALAAGKTFAALGDTDRRDQADTLVTKLDNRQRRLLMLLGAGVLAVISWLVFWLRGRGTPPLNWGTRSSSLGSELKVS
jgi:hypothetical protein